ncbi:MAG: VPS10 domain-containing protein [Gemmatimonadaceae bacterium]
MVHALRRLFSYAALSLFAAPLLAQGGGTRETFNVSQDPLLASFRFRSIGPASMGGRVDDIEVSLSDPNVIYVGYAVGGVFKSEDNGVSFKPVFETYGSASIGDIAIHPTNPDIVYVGTGEPNNRQTSSFGDGLYKSTDGGKTFAKIGLAETQTIARIVIDKNNPEVVYVASPGHLFGPNPERGVYKTTDGGKTWNKIKFIDDNTGFTDIAIDPSNSNIIYAASYERRRTSCCFNGGGPGSALWKSEDAGKTWNKLASGLPTGTMGRIALSVSASNPNTVYVQIETGESGTELRGRGAAETPGGAPAGGGGGGGGGGAGGRGGFDWCNNGAPAPEGRGGRGAGRGGRGGGRAGRGGAGAPAESSATPAAPPALNPASSGIYRSDNKGRSFTLVSNCDSRPMYFSQLRVDPENVNTIYVAGLPVAKSLNGGKTFATLDAAGGNGEPAHVDQHAIWVDPRNSKHLMIGNDGGLDISYDQGKSWDFVATMATGLAYVVTADDERPYNVYIGLQDNNSWGGPSSKRGRGGINNMDWFSICGGDGFYTGVNVQRPNLVYCESQDGNTSRYDLNTGQTTSIRPVAGAGRGGVQIAGGASATCVDGRAPGGRGGGGGGGGGRGGGRANVINAAGGEGYRFNWNTPYILSSHNPSIIYLGGNRLFKSYDGGTSWVASPDLTKQVDRCRITVMGVGGDKAQLSKNDGLTAYSTIISVSESPVMPGVVWAGTDDGNLQMSRDGGQTFTEVGKNITGLPQGALTNDDPFWISRIDASHFDAGTAYVAVDGHRSDDLHPYLFVTRDYGRTFQSVAGDLPSYGNIQVVKEDPKNKDLLFVGTEFGLYTSLNGGKHWEKFMTDYPTVRTDDIFIHPRESDVLVATHGRSVFIADDISALEQWPSVGSADVYLFSPRDAVAWLNDITNNPHVGGQKNFIGENAPRGTAITYYLKSAATDVKVSVVDAQGRTLCTSEGATSAGINRVQWSLIAPELAGQGGGGFGAGRGGGRAGQGGPPDTSCTAAAGGRGGGGRGGGNAEIQPGVYTVKLAVNGQTYTKPVEVLEDKWFRAR